jgi:hypothetical protein
MYPPGSMTLFTCLVGAATFAKLCSSPAVFIISP